MLLTSLYFGMLFTNWGFAIVDGEADAITENAEFSLWAKIVAQWFTIVLFTVSVSLYACDPHRII